MLGEVFHQGAYAYLYFVNPTPSNISPVIWLRDILSTQ